MIRALSRGSPRGAFPRRPRPVVAFLAFSLLFLPAFPERAGAEHIYSETWGFRLDLPEGFVLQGGDGSSRFSFSLEEITLDIAVWPASEGLSVRDRAADVGRRIGSAGDITVFDYHGGEAALMELSFRLPPAPGSPGEALSGWGLCLELGPEPGAAVPEAGAGQSGSGKAKLLALTYGPASRPRNALYLSALDSIAPRPEDGLRPGPITEFAWPRGERIPVRPAMSGVRADIRQGDAEAAAALIEREFQVLTLYADTPLWKEAWSRFYRFIFRDSVERLEGIADALLRGWGRPGPEGAAGGREGGAPLRDGEIPAKALAWVQEFSYERNLQGADFVDLVSAALEGRGDCDSRALLWAVILERADIHAAIMVSREYSHAMGLADMDGDGARFDFAGIPWLVAETTAKVPLGQINSRAADPARWLGVELHP